MKTVRQDALTKKTATSKVGGQRRAIDGENDAIMRAAKDQIQNRSRWLVGSGQRSQESLCLFSAADVKAATIHFPDVDFFA